MKKRGISRSVSKLAAHVPARPEIRIIAGPNGAGKTTFAREYLPREAGCRAFVNADLIASGLSPFQPELESIRAGRLMLEEIESLVRARVSFAFETTLSGLGYARKIAKWQQSGYHVVLVYLRLRSVRLAQIRVRNRVRSGGHSIPPDVVRRRFRSGWRNFETIYRPLVDEWEVYDNSTNPIRLLSRGMKS